MTKLSTTSQVADARRQRRRARVNIWCCVAVLGLVATACNADDNIDTFTITQDAPELQAVDGDDEQALEATLFHADVERDDGTVGELVGYLLTVDYATDSDPYEERIGTLVFHFGGDQLIATGGSFYSLTELEMDDEVVQTRAIIGGTGRYIGAEGEVDTTRNADGTYTHTITLVS